MTFKPHRTVLLAAFVALATVVVGCAMVTTRPGPDGGGDVGIVDTSVDGGGQSDGGDASACLPSAETCNGRDDDCDGATDEEPEASTWCGARCGVDVCPSARAIAPLSSSLVTTTRPRLRWVLVGDATSARVEICRDRACSDVVLRLDDAGDGSAVPSVDLPGGVLFWRLVPLRDAHMLPAVSTPWVLRVPVLDHAVEGATGHVTDVNADGHADVVVVHSIGTSGARELIVLLGSASGLVQGARLPFVDSALEALGDLDGDGATDAVATAPGGHYVFRTGGPVGLVAAATSMPDPAVGAVGSSSLADANDVDGDGYVDLLVDATIAGEGFRIARGWPGGVATTPTTVPSAGFADPTFPVHIHAIGDLDADGQADLVVLQACMWSPLLTCPSDRGLWLARGGAGGVGVPTMWTLAPSANDGEAAGPIEAAGDVDGDGRIDLIAVAPGQSPLLLMQRDVGARTDVWRSLDAEPSTAWLGAACDLDGDGTGDVILTRSPTFPTPPPEHPTVLRAGSPSGPSTSDVAVSTLPATRARCLGDDDGDGRSEIAVLEHDPAREGTFYVRVYRGVPGGHAVELVQSVEIERVVAMF